MMRIWLKKVAGVKAQVRSVRANVYLNSSKRRLWASASAVADSREMGESLSSRYSGVHHVAIICENLERSMDFYQGVLDLSINDARPDDKLPYAGCR